MRACVEYLLAHKALVWRQNQGAVRGEYRGRKRFVRFTSRSGISDIIGVTPWGQFLAVECKTATGRLSPAQAEFLDEVRAKGGIGLVVRSLDDLDEAWTRLCLEKSVVR